MSSETLKIKISQTLKQLAANKREKHKDRRQISLTVAVTFTNQTKSNKISWGHHPVHPLHNCAEGLTILSDCSCLQGLADKSPAQEQRSCLGLCCYIFIKCPSSSILPTTCFVLAFSEGKIINIIHF